MYPDVPIGGQDGASDEESSYLHIIVCYGEYEKMKELVGANRARQIMEFWTMRRLSASFSSVIDYFRHPNEPGTCSIMRQRDRFQEPCHSISCAVYPAQSALVNQSDSQRAPAFH